MFRATMFMCLCMYSLCSAGGSSDDGEVFSFHDAARQGNLDVLQDYIEQKGRFPWEKDDDGHTPLYHAITGDGENNIEVIRYLLTVHTISFDDDGNVVSCEVPGHDPNPRHSYCKGPLHWAVQAQKPQYVKALLAFGANPEAHYDATWLDQGLQVAKSRVCEWWQMMTDDEYYLEEVLGNEVVSASAAPDLSTRVPSPLEKALGFDATDENKEIIALLLSHCPNLEQKTASGDTLYKALVSKNLLPEGFDYDQYLAGNDLLGNGFDLFLAVLGS